MPRLFFDTSALVKRYYEEAGSGAVDELIEVEDDEVVITSLSVVETASALRRKQNRDEITGDDVDRLLSAFFEGALDGFVVLPMDESFSGRHWIWYSKTTSGPSIVFNWPPRCQ